jgi:hypothetical protein
MWCFGGDVFGCQKYATVLRFILITTYSLFANPDFANARIATSLTSEGSTHRAQSHYGVQECSGIGGKSNSATPAQSEQRNHKQGQGAVKTGAPKHIQFPPMLKPLLYVQIDGVRGISQVGKESSNE